MNLQVNLLCLLCQVFMCAETKLTHYSEPVLNPKPHLPDILPQVSSESLYGLRVLQNGNPISSHPDRFRQVVKTKS